MLIAAPVPITDDEMSHNISGVGQDHSNESNGFQRHDIEKTGCEFRYYKAKELYSLPPEQQKELKAWRTEHERKRNPEHNNGEPDSMNGRRNRRSKEKIAYMKTKLQIFLNAQQATISAMTIATKPPPTTSNQALTRVPFQAYQNITHS